MAREPIKVIILGEASVGKTSLLNQWLHGDFSDKTTSTISAGLHTCRLTIDGSPQALDIWDTAGTPQLRAVVPMYCRGAAIAAIVFDLTQARTFDTVAEWHSFVSETAQPIFLLVGNKLDVRDRRVVDFDAAVQLADRLGLQYVEVSAKTGEGIKGLEHAVEECARDYRSSLSIAQPSKEGIAIATKSAARPVTCC
jgi:small GTP-binding protein